MGLVAGYDNDVFVSYSHIDNRPFGKPERGWVDTFHENLQNFVDVHVGRRTHIWRDLRLTGAEVFSAEIEQQLRSSAVLVSVISNGYVLSDWCKRELRGFTAEALARTGLRCGNLSRSVKVLRLPVDLKALPSPTDPTALAELTSLLEDMLGTAFYRLDAQSNRARDLLLDASPDAMQVFLARVDDVAHDLSRLLNSMMASAASVAAVAAPAGTPAAATSAGAPADAATPARTVYLAWTTADLTVERDRLRRELEAHALRVLPVGEPPLAAAAAAVRESK